MVLTKDPVYRFLILRTSHEGGGRKFLRSHFVILRDLLNHRLNFPFLIIAMVGEGVGDFVGALVGAFVGALVGAIVGCCVGDDVGLDVVMDGGHKPK